jgi:uncharacterized membrane protein YdjX (TVP38/TMEM64 family)
MVWHKLQRVISIIFLLAIIGSLLAYLTFGYEFDLEGIRQYVKDFGIWAPLIYIALFVFIAIFIPSTPLMAIAGVLFGFKYGLVYTLIGGMISAILLFIISRKLGRERVEKILEHKYLIPLYKYNSRLESKGIWDLVILRVLPIMPFNVLNILMGVSKIGTKNYILGTLLGLIPSNVITVYFGVFLTKIL